MEGRMRSDEHSGIVLKNRNSSGCLIVKKKADGASGSGSRLVPMSKQVKKRPRMITSESESSDELLKLPRRRAGTEPIRRHCNGPSACEKVGSEGNEFGRKRNRAVFIRHDEDCFVGIRENSGEVRRRLDVFDFDEYDGVDTQTVMPWKGLDDGGMRFSSPVSIARGSIDQRYDTGSGRAIVTERRKKRHFENIGSSSLGSRGNKEQSSLLRERSMVGDSDSDEPIRVQGKNGVLKVMVNKKKKMMSESRKSFNKLEIKQIKSQPKIQNAVKMSIPFRQSAPSRAEVLDRSSFSVRTEIDDATLQKTTSRKKGKDQNQASVDNDRLLKLERKNKKALKSANRLDTEVEKTSDKPVAAAKIKEGKIRRGSGTEKQRLRERIRGMLLEAGWTIDYRPRRNRDYLDAVYINPLGTAYWSIIKAYDALLKQLDDNENRNKHGRDGVAFTPITDEVLSQLTRKTRKKMEKDMEKKQRGASESENDKEAREFQSTRHEAGSVDSDAYEEKLSSFIKPSGKPLRNRVNKKIVSGGMSTKVQSYLRHSSERLSSGPSSLKRHGRKSKKIGRCTLLVRSNVESKISDTDGAGSLSGKRTLLSWLIDSGTVQLSQKVMYMNRRRTRVMLEGWITRDGIHCGCCSKILAVSKFEIHAGSKLRQPYQNIYLDSGVSLLQCQMDAWNGQEDAQNLDFLYVDIDGDDPNDDTCGICGDGGDLICCDGCPSTFHQSCLDIQMLPSGDWHCPNCTCKFCGTVAGDATTSEDATPCKLITCNMCEKKYHILCVEDAATTGSAPSVPSFCGQKCQELFGQLQKLLGVKNELEAGFSWSLIHRMDTDLDSSSRELAHRVESNSKLAVAFAVMDECFLPIVDRRSGTNLMRNVLYNCGSNFSRLNFGGFYTAVLERSDEIISAASIRFRGRELAEMPFIGTRHLYRRQGMCRRLFRAIESALKSLKVEKLVLPAIAEFRHAWTEIFGFSPLEDSVKKETRSMNLLAFPGVYMLQKRLLEQESNGWNYCADSGAENRDVKRESLVVPEADCQPDTGSSADHEHRGLGNGHLVSGSKNSESSDSEPNSHDRIYPSNTVIPFMSCIHGSKLPSEDNTVSGSPRRQSQSWNDSDVDATVNSEEIRSSTVEASCTYLQSETKTSESDMKDVASSIKPRDGRKVGLLDGDGSEKRADGEKLRDGQVDAAAARENRLSTAETVSHESRLGDKLGTSAVDENFHVEPNTSPGGTEVRDPPDVMPNP